VAGEKQYTGYFITVDPSTDLSQVVRLRAHHLPQTHCLIQLFCSVLDEVAPGAILITETNGCRPVHDTQYYTGTWNERIVTVP
jgi:hypothetical protein